MIITHALAKINLTLTITDINENGYHNLESVFLFLPDIYDILVIDCEKEYSEKAAIIENVFDEKNSIQIAAALLRKNFALRIPYVEVQKKIPIAAGLGGGSSDAACFIAIVLQFWNIKIEQKVEFLKKVHVLGADAVVFLHKYIFNKTHFLLRGTGLDGAIEDCDISYLRGKFVVLVNNGKRLSTADVYARCVGGKSLTEAAVALEPAIAVVLEDISQTGPMFFNMSGSGATCFGIYNNEEQALRAQKKLQKKYCFVQISEILT